MSKSDPNSAIFMEDSEAEVKTKIKKAYCPPLQVRLGFAFAVHVSAERLVTQCGQGDMYNYMSGWV